MSEYTTRLAACITNRQREGLLGNVEITELQVALVCRALADHTLLMQALNFHRPDDGIWPEATSLGRFFHHLADDFEHEARTT